LSAVPSRTIVHRGAGVDLGVIAVYARLTGRRLVFSTANVSDFEHDRLESNGLYLLLYKLGVRLAHAIVVQTDEQIGLCVSAFRREPVLIKSVAPHVEGEDEPPEAFLWVGRLVSYKRPLEYVALARALPEAKFWMLGVPTPHLDGDDLVAQAVAAQAREAPNLELLAPRRHQEVQWLMSRAVASVNTADFEGMPNVLLEGWSRGVPALVLTHDPGGVISTHGLGSYAEGSPEKLADLARELWLTREHRSDLAQRCRTYVRTHHAVQAIAEQWGRVLFPATLLPRGSGPGQS
jgi:glycosyltransferase involved in cell wall biosynthesis